MEIPHGATSYCPPLSPLFPGFLPGQSVRHTVRPHGTQDWLLIYTMKGAGIYRFGNEVYESRAHEVTLFRPQTPHAYQASPEKGWDLYFAHFLPKVDWLSWLQWPEHPSGMMKLSIQDSALARRIEKRLEKVVRLYGGAQARREVFAQNAFEEVLLWCDSINPERKTVALDFRIQKAADFLCANVAQPFSEKALAKTSGLSASRLRHLFTEQMGCSPRLFQERQRMARAKHLLTYSRQTISEISEDLGFENPFYFSLRFKKETGKNPRSYRENILSGI
ncbi:MAG: helix-turn-helix domain-containing protein [Chthoniobacterales bacterium]